MNSQKRDKKEVPNSPDRTFDSSKRRFLKVAGAGLVAGLFSLTGLDALAKDPSNKADPDKGKVVAQADAKKGPMLAQNEAGGKTVAAAPKLAELEGIALSELQDLAAKSGHAVIRNHIVDGNHFLTYHVSIDGQLVSISAGIWTNGRKKMISFAIDGTLIGGTNLDALDQLCNDEGHPFKFAKMFLDIYQSKDKKSGTMIDVYIVPVDSQHGEMVRGRPLALVPFAVSTREIWVATPYRID